MNIQNIDINLIDQHPENPRKDLGDLTELANSIKESGIHQNLTVVRNGERYTCIIGHRRLAASKLATPAYALVIFELKNLAKKQKREERKERRQ